MWENGRMEKVRRSHKPHQNKQVIDQTRPPSADDEAKLEGARTMTSAAAGGKNLREGPEWQEGRDQHQYSELGKSSKRQPFDFISC